MTKPRLDLTGQKFGYLTAVKRDLEGRGVKYWICECECGNVKSIALSNLRGGLSKSCGCKKGGVGKTKNHTTPLEGLRFGNIVVGARVSKPGETLAIEYECTCDCGNKVVKNANVIKASPLAFCSSSCKLLLLRTSVRNKYRSYKQRCSLLDRPFNLTPDEFYEICTKPCHYCGNMDGEINTIDRKDSDKGYSVENCVSSCLTCNISKGVMPYNDYIEKLKRIGQMHAGIARRYQD